MGDIVKDGMAAAEASFLATSGRIPDNFRILARHAPGAFAGYGVMRAAVMKDRDAGGALDLKTKELIFALLDTLVNQPAGAKAHAASLDWFGTYQEQSMRAWQAET